MFTEKLRENLMNAMDKNALVYSDGTTCSYAELEQISGKVSAWLKSQGVGKEGTVLITMPRGIQILEAMVGVIRAGACYVVCESSMANERIRFILKDSQCKKVIMQENWQEILDYTYSAEFAQPDPHDAAYIVYTSGTTGNPKGVVHEYGNYDQSVMAKRIHGESICKPEYVLGLNSPLNFVAAVDYIVNALYAGATILLDEVKSDRKALYHLPGLFEFYEFYRLFLPLYREHREYFYDWCEIASIYGAPADCIWNGGRVGFGEDDPREVFALMEEYGISARLTFSNSLIREDLLSDRTCNRLCQLLEQQKHAESGVIIHSDLLLAYLRKNYPDLYYVSSTTKVLTDFKDLVQELDREEFRYVVPDFRLNKAFDRLEKLSQEQKDKVEFLCNECCWFGCRDRKRCYENVSRKNLGEICEDHHCNAPDAEEGYRFSKAMTNPGFIGTEAIRNVYLPMGFSNFKIEGRGLGSALILEFLLYYMTKPEYQLLVREEIYLDSMLDLV